MAPPSEETERAIRAQIDSAGVDGRMKSKSRLEAMSFHIGRD